MGSTSLEADIDGVGWLYSTHQVKSEALPVFCEDSRQRVREEEARAAGMPERDAIETSYLWRTYWGRAVIKRGSTPSPMKSICVCTLYGESVKRLQNNEATDVKRPATQTNISSASRGTERKEVLTEMVRQRKRIPIGKSKPPRGVLAEKATLVTSIQSWQISAGLGRTFTSCSCGGDLRVPRKPQ
eukprot:gene7277-12970_t